MANINLTDSAMVVGVAVLAGGASLFEENSKVKQPDPTKINIVVRNAGQIADYGLFALATLNHAMDLGYPKGSSAEALYHATLAMATRRVTHQVGENIMKLKTTVGPKAYAPSMVASPSAVLLNPGTRAAMEAQQGVKQITVF